MIPRRTKTTALLFPCAALLCFASLCFVFPGPVLLCFSWPFFALLPFVVLCFAVLYFTFPRFAFPCSSPLCFPCTCFDLLSLALLFFFLDLVCIAGTDFLRFALLRRSYSALLCFSWRSFPLPFLGPICHKVFPRRALFLFCLALHRSAPRRCASLVLRTVPPILPLDAFTHA